MEVSRPGLVSRSVSRLAFAGLGPVSVSGLEILVSVSVLCSQGLSLAQRKLSRPPRPQKFWLKKLMMTSYPYWFFVDMRSWSWSQILTVSVSEGARRFRSQKAWSPSWSLTLRPRLYITGKLCPEVWKRFHYLHQILTPLRRQLEWLINTRAKLIETIKVANKLNKTCHTQVKKLTMNICYKFLHQGWYHYVLSNDSLHPLTPWPSGLCWQISWFSKGFIMGTVDPLQSQES